MNMHKHQQGVGLMEVLVALLILAIGILGFVALQVRAADAANEAGDRITAMNIARDLAERIRINREDITNYKTAVNAQGAGTIPNCFGNTTTYTANCVGKDMAAYDAKQIFDKANSYGHKLRIDNCIGSESLNCIYVSWGETSVVANVQTCVDTSTGAYKPGAQCIVMEAY